ncbi:Uncharacterised protein [Serratia plymuthica]|nr:Uncharacterised protein [Serratia plymuthica]
MRSRPSTLTPKRPALLHWLVQGPQQTDDASFNVSSGLRLYLLPEPLG